MHTVGTSATCEGSFSQLEPPGWGKDTVPRPGGPGRCRRLAECLGAAGMTRLCVQEGEGPGSLPQAAHAGRPRAHQVRHTPAPTTEGGVLWPGASGVAPLPCLRRGDLGAPPSSANPPSAAPSDLPQTRTSSCPRRSLPKQGPSQPSARKCLPPSLGRLRARVG